MGSKERKNRKKAEKTKSIEFVNLTRDITSFAQIKILTVIIFMMVDISQVIILRLSLRRKEKEKILIPQTLSFLFLRMHLVLQVNLSLSLLYFSSLFLFLSLSQFSSFPVFRISILFPSLYVFLFCSPDSSLLADFFRDLEIFRIPLAVMKLRGFFLPLFYFLFFSFPLFSPSSSLSSYFLMAK